MALANNKLNLLILLTLTSLIVFLSIADSLTIKKILPPLNIASYKEKTIILPNSQLSNLCENNIYPIKSILHLPLLYYPIIKINKGEVIDNIPIEFKSGEHEIRIKRRKKNGPKRELWAVS